MVVYRRDLQVVQSENFLLAHLSDSVVMSTLGQRDLSGLDDADEKQFGIKKTEFRCKMFEIIDSVDAELTWRFSDNELDLISCETFYPNSAFFLNSDYIKPLVDKYSYVEIDTTKLKAQCVVAKQLFSDSNAQILATF